jgi:uncharacterized protein (DUF58 family)
MLFIVSFAISWMFIITKLLFIVFLILILIDIVMLYNKNTKGIFGTRICPEKFSNGDENEINIYIENQYNFNCKLKIIDETPFQFQFRKASFRIPIASGDKTKINYHLRPTMRGEYMFGALNIYATGIIGLVSRRFVYDEKKIVPVYPSYLQMRKYELLAISNRLNEYGIKKLRKIGQSIEFEQIKNYVAGDDFRTINWKASSRRNELMVNHYSDEKSQQVYSIIDKGRLMKMPFEGLSLLDYAINTSLVISNIAIKKDDKAGLITFNKNVESFVKADKKSIQMYKIQEALYNQKTTFQESDFEKMSINVRNRLSQRSLLIVYTNFESVLSMRRQQDYLASLTKNHVVVVVFFENTEVKKIYESESKTLEDVYIRTIADKFVLEKKQIVKELKQRGIYSILTSPKKLTVNTINKYLEFKSKGII